MSQKAEKNLANTEIKISNGVLSGFGQVVFYPVNLVKVLIQVGHEPLPPFKSRNIFGREQLFYPNSYSYLRYIYSMEGVTGMYRGLGMKLISHSVGTVVYNHAKKLMDENDELAAVTKDEEDPKKIEVFVRKTSKEITIRCWSVVLSHPFHVMALRCMAQFIGGEDVYSSWNVVQNIREIYKTEGVSGFFDGLIPRLLFEASAIAISNGLIYLFKTYILEEKEFDMFIDLMASLLTNSITYPLSVVTSVSCISGSTLLAGRPPKMPLYKSWVEVFKHLYENNEMKRGASSFFRVYSRPPISYTANSLYQ